MSDGERLFMFWFGCVFNNVEGHSDCEGVFGAVLQFKYFCNVFEGFEQPFDVDWIVGELFDGGH